MTYSYRKRVRCFHYYANTVLSNKFFLTFQTCMDLHSTVLCESLIRFICCRPCKTITCIYMVNYITAMFLL